LEIDVHVRCEHVLPREQLHAIATLPATFRASEKSLYDLVTEIGYERLRPALSVDQLAAFLRDRPELIDPWVHYSEDKRTSEGWYLLGAPHWYVSYPGRELELEREMKERTRTPADACATFILLELDSIAGVDPER
jgi:hypothetical protein